MEPFRIELPPPKPGSLGPGLLIGAAIVCGAAGPAWLGAMGNGLVAPVPPRLLTWPVPALLPFVGVVLMLCGAAWYAALRAATTTTVVDLVGLRLSIDGEDLQLTSRTYVRRDGTRMEVVFDESTRILRSEDTDGLDALTARIRARVRRAGSEADVPEAMRRLAREKV